MSMISPARAIEIGVPKFKDEYEDAVTILWKHEKQITPTIDIVSFLMAQAVQESRFNPNAVSPMGAVGLTQFMLPTANQMAKELKPKLALFANGFDRQNPIQSIWAQVYYMNKLYNVWNKGRSSDKRIELAFACYNAGTRNILKAQKKSGDKKFWDNIKIYLPLVTGENSKETIGYVDYIFKYANDVNKTILSLQAKS